MKKVKLLAHLSHGPSVNYCHLILSVVSLPTLDNSSNQFSSEATRPVFIKSHVKPPWAWELKIVEWSYSIDQDRHRYVKTLKIFLLQNQSFQTGIWYIVSGM